MRISRRLRPLVFPLLIVVAALGARAEDYDVIIRHARIVDGTGAPAVTGDVAIRSDRIAAVGQLPAGAKAKTEIDAAGRVVAPGFIDVHTHSEDITEIPVAENFLRMGVTTIVTGNCGMSKVDIADFFASIERTHVALNVATLIGHGSVRFQVMGGSFVRPPTDDEIAKMRALVDQAMRDGALGLSTGLIYLPGTFAKTEELIALAQAAAAHGGIYTSHMRYENARILEAFTELVRIAREAKIPAEVSHIKLSSPAAWGRADEIIAFLDKARAEGLKITEDEYVYTAAATDIGSRIPEEAREGGRARYRERLADPVKKAAYVADMKATLLRNKQPDYSFAVIAQFTPDPRLNGKTIPQAAQLLRSSATIDDQIETILDLEARGGASAVFHGIDEVDLQKFLVQPLTMIASDGGPKQPSNDVPHPRSYGNNARVLGRYVRELKLLSLEDAVRKMTSLPAETFHLRDRGALRIGAIADLVIFDPATVGDPSTYADPQHYATGFSDVIVNGVPVIRANDLTTARPGRPVKRGE